MNCNFCHSEKIEQIYKPVNSQIELDIHICQSCGLVHSSYNKIKYERSNVVDVESKFTLLDCDAKYSEIRVGKQQMTPYFFNIIKSIQGFAPKKVLDIKSARGHFALKALEAMELDYIDCVEEDQYMTFSYNQNPKINLIEGKYSDVVEKDYDLVYSCHTLEHYQNPSKYLNFIRNLLKDDGYFYIDIPNLYNIDSELNIDEFFYDKHLYYYDIKTISSFIASLGFEILAQSETPQNIGLLFKKSKNKSIYPVTNQYIFNKRLIESYITNLADNREKIKNSQLLHNNINYPGDYIVYGAGRILSALERYGNFDISKVDYLIDDYLCEVTSTMFGLPVHSKDILKNRAVSCAVVLLKHPSQEIKNLLNNAKIIYLTDILNG